MHARKGTIQLGTVKPKPKNFEQPMYAQEIYIKSQRGRKEKNKQTVQCAGNVGDQVAIGFSFESDWLRG